MIRKILRGYVAKTLIEAGYQTADPEVLPTTDLQFGDYYSPIALKLAKAGNKQPAVKIAKFLVAKLTKNEELFKAEVAPNGFINFKISAKYLRSSVRKIIEEDEKFG